MSLTIYSIIPELIFFGFRILLQPAVHNILKLAPISKIITPQQRRLIDQRIARMICGLVLFFGSMSFIWADGGIMFRNPYTEKTDSAIFWCKGLYGYLWADLLEIVYSHFKINAPIQLDLMIHHLAGILYLRLVILFDTGWWFPGCGMLAEILTLFSGPVFLLSSIDQNWAAKTKQLFLTARVYAIAFFRLPIWLLVSWVTYREQYLRVSGPITNNLFKSNVGGLLVAFSLDIYWILMLNGFIKSRGEVRIKN